MSHDVDHVAIAITSTRQALARAEAMACDLPDSVSARIVIDSLRRRENVLIDHLHRCEAQPTHEGSVLELIYSDTTPPHLSL